MTLKLLSFFSSFNKPSSFARTLSEHRFYGTYADSTKCTDSKKIVVNALERMTHSSANRVRIAFVASYEKRMELFTTCAVAPHAGAWIETKKNQVGYLCNRSPPTRGRGLKPICAARFMAGPSRPPRGGVD